MNRRTLRLLLIALIVAEAALWFFGPQPKDHLPDLAAATAAGKRPDWWDDAAMGVHYAATVCAGLFVLLLASAKLWSRPIADSKTSPSKADASDIRQLNPKYFWPLILAASLLCLGLRLPLASKSLWWDEAWVIEQVSLGRWKADSKQPDKLKFQAHDWSRCAWYYQKPTNHAPMSLLQKASITAWQKITHAKKEQFSDLSARVPALVASCLAVMLLGLLLRGWGRPGAGVAAALVLAVHPWHVRYGVDARAYALVVPLCIAGMLAITRIIKTRGDKLLPWLGWGITEFLWLWAYPNAALDIAALNLVAAFLLWKSHTGPDRWSALFRLAATNVFAAICLIQVFLPNLIQARHWVGQEADKHVLNPDLAASTLSQLIFGCEYWLPGNNPPVFPQLNHAPLAPTVVPFLVATIVGLFVIWIHLLVRRKKIGYGAACLSALLISSFTFAAVTWTLQSYFYPRFVIALLPVFIASSCLVIATERWRIALSLVAGVVLLVPYASSIFFYATHPYQPLHNVASFVQTDSTEQAKPPLIACYGLGREVMPVYYPAAVPLENAADLAKLQQRARTEQRLLYVIYGYDNFNRSMLGDGFKTLDDRAQFKEIKTFDGIEPEFTFHVLKAMPALNAAP